MRLARQGAGSLATLRAYASQIHPVFMVPPVAAAIAGGTLPFAPGAAEPLAGEVAAFDPIAALFHAGAIVAAVYTAHLKDGFVDFHRRGEDDDHPLTVAGCRLGLVVAGALFGGCLLGIWVRGGPLATALTAPTGALGYFHAPQLDTTPLGATMGYPLGIALAVLGGAAAQSGTIDGLALAVAGILVVTLTGVKVVDDAQDVAYDRSIGKRTVAVVVGPANSRRIANALFLGTGVGVCWLTIGGPLPALAPIAPLAFGAVVLRARRYGPAGATALLVRGTYLLLALLLAAIWLRGHLALSLPDVGVLGSETYLATEVGFGLLAAILLVRVGPGACWRAARTIAVLYPVAYVWDWYSLEIGIFAIRLHTGVDLLGIPLEEHLFMLVVPALVLGVHETLAEGDRETDANEASG